MPFIPKSLYKPSHTLWDNGDWGNANVRSEGRRIIRSLRRIFSRTEKELQTCQLTNLTQRNKSSNYLTSPAKASIRKTYQRPCNYSNTQNTSLLQPLCAQPMKRPYYTRSCFLYGLFTASSDHSTCKTDKNSSSRQRVECHPWAKDSLQFNHYMHNMCHEDNEALVHLPSMQYTSMCFKQQWPTALP